MLSRGMLRQAFSLKTPAAHTTENFNWDIIEEKQKINSEERAQCEEHVEIFTFSSRLEVLPISSPLIEKKSVTTIR